MISENHLQLAKSATKLVSSFGVSKIVHSIISNNVTSESTLDTVKIWAGTLAIVGVVQKHTSAHVDNAFDETVEFVRDLKDQFDEMKSKPE